MSNFDNYETINGRNISPKLRPIDARAVAASGLDAFQKDLSSDELRKIVQKNEIERLD